MSDHPEVADLPCLNAEFVRRFNEQVEALANSEPTEDLSQIASLEQELADATKQLSQSKERLEDLESQLSQAKSECHESARQLQVKSDEIVRLESELKDQQQAAAVEFNSIAEIEQVDHLRNENRELRSVTHRQQLEIDALKEDNRQTWLANEDFSRAIKDKTEEAELLRKKLRELKVDTDHQHSQTIQLRLNELRDVEQNREELLNFIREEESSISGLNAEYKQYGLNLTQVSTHKLAELAELFVRERELKMLLRALVMNVRHGR